MPSRNRRRLGLLGGALLVVFAAQGVAIFIDPGSHTVGSVTHRELLGPAQVGGDIIDLPTVIDGPLVPCAPLTLAAALGLSSSKGRGGVVVRRDTDGAFVAETIVHEVDDGTLSLLLDGSCPTSQTDAVGDRYETTVTDSGWVRSGVSQGYEEATELRLVDGTLVAVSVSTTVGGPPVEDAVALADAAVVQLDERAVRATDLGGQRVAYGIIGLVIVGLLVGVATLAKRSYLGVALWVVAYGVTGVTLAVTLTDGGVFARVASLVAFVPAFGLFRGALARLHARATAGELTDVSADALEPPARAVFVDTDRRLAELGYGCERLAVNSLQRSYVAIWRAPEPAPLVYGTIAATRSRARRYLTVCSPVAHIEANLETSEFGGTPALVQSLREAAVGMEIIGMLDRHAAVKDELERAGLAFAPDAGSLDLDEATRLAEVAFARIPLRYAVAGVIWTVVGRRRKGARRPRGWDRTVARLLNAQRLAVLP